MKYESAVHNRHRVGRCELQWRSACMVVDELMNDNLKVLTRRGPEAIADAAERLATLQLAIAVRDAAFDSWQTAQCGDIGWGMVK